MLPLVAAWPQWLRFGLLLIVIAFCLGAMIGLLCRLPGVPYNLKELMWQGGNPLNWLMFGLWTCWFGIGSGIIALVLRRVTLSLLGLPLGVAGLSIISFIFLSLSITPESIHDIVGSPVWTQESWNTIQTWTPLAQAIDRYPGLVDWMEMCWRYIGVYAPIPILVSLVMILLGDFVGYARRIRTRLPLLGMALLSLWLCKLIVVDYASTTNLVELIAPKALFGTGGIVWIYLALGVLAMGAVSVWATIIRLVSWRIALLSNILLIPLGFFAILQGLDQAVQKYGHSFSALQFLLSGDRTGHWSDFALMLGWISIHIVFCLVVSLGLRLAVPSWPTGTVVVIELK